MSTMVSKAFARGVLGAVPDVWPGLCLALLTDAPEAVAGDMDVTFVEVPGSIGADATGYVRADVPKSAWSDPLGNAPASMPLGEDIEFAEANAQWPPVTWIAVMPNDYGPYALMCLELTSPVVVRTNKRLRVPAGLMALRHFSV